MFSTNGQTSFFREPKNVYAGVLVKDDCSGTGEQEIGLLRYHSVGLLPVRGLYTGEK